MFGFKTLAAGVIVFAWGAASAPLLVACPNCREAVEAGPGELQSGYAWSIALLLGVPAVLAGIWTAIGWSLARSRRADPGKVGPGAGVGHLGKAGPGVADPGEADAGMAGPAAA